MYIPAVTIIVTNTMSRLEYDEDINTLCVNVHVRHKALAKELRRLVETTTEYKPFKMDVKYLPLGTITYHNSWFSQRTQVHQHTSS